MKRWALFISAAATAAALVLVGFVRSGGPPLPGAANVDGSSALPAAHTSGMATASSRSPSVRETPSPPRFVTPPAGSAASPAEGTRPWHETIAVEARQRDEAVAAAMDQIGTRMNLGTSEVERLRSWVRTAADLRFRLMTEPPAMSNDEIEKRRQAVDRLLAARAKAEFHLFGGDASRWQAYRRLSTAAAQGKLDQVTEDGSPRRRPPSPGDESGVVTVVGTPLWKQDSSDFDRYFDDR